MMRFSGVCSAIVILVLSGAVSAEQAGWQLFDKVQHAVKHYNFDTSFVVLKGGKVDTYRWLHGKTAEQEIEHLVLRAFLDHDLVGTEAVAGQCLARAGFDLGEARIERCALYLVEIGEEDLQALFAPLSD